MAGTATAVSERVARRQAARYDEQDAQQYAEAPPQAGARGKTTHSRSSRTWPSFAQGVLTDEEFAAAKEEALGI